MLRFWEMDGDDALEAGERAVPEARGGLTARRIPARAKRRGQ